MPKSKYQYQQRENIMTRAASILTLVLLLFIVIACGEDERAAIAEEGQKPSVQATEFVIPDEYAGRRTSVLRADLDGDGYEDAALALYSTSPVAAEIGFDSVLVYRYVNSGDSGYFDRVAGFDYYYGESADLTDLNNDDSFEIVIKTNTGGINPLISCGLSVISFRDGNFQQIYSFDDGMPEVRLHTDGEGSSMYAILVYKEFLPFDFSEMEGVAILDSVIVPGAIEASRQAAIRQDIRSSVLAEAWGDYQDVAAGSLTSPEEVFALYTALVRCLSYLQTNPDEEKLSLLRSKEQQNLWRKSLPPQYRDALNTLLRNSATPVK